MTRPTHARNAAIFANNITQKETDDDITLRINAYNVDPVGAGRRLDAIPAHKRKGGQVKHASDIFPAALAELFKLAERGKARNPRTRETRAKDTMQRDTRNGGRETARVSRKEKREQLKLKLT